MANPTKGEVSLVLFEDDENLDRKQYTLKFSNAGHREMEDFLDIEQSEVLGRFHTGRVGRRLLNAVFYGATRKFHRRDFPTVLEVDDLLDQIDDEAEDTEAELRKLAVASYAAYTRNDPSEIEAGILGEEPKSNGSSGATEAGPKEDQDKPKRKPAQKPAKSSG